MSNKFRQEACTEGVEKLEGLSHVSDILSYENDIAPYRAVAIYSGVGSGKTTFAENIIKELNNQGKNVLLITSRRIKVDQQIKQAELGNEDEDNAPVMTRHFGYNGNVDLNEAEFTLFINRMYDILDDKYGNNKRRLKDGRIQYWTNICCTPATIEFWFKHLFKGNYKLHESDLLDPLNLFDLIIIDEIHSIITDANYQNAPFHIYNMIKRYANNEEDFICKNMIFMTGTPECIHPLLQSMFYDLVTINLFKECVNLKPKHIHFEDVDITKRNIINQLKAGKKIIYAYNGKIIDLNDYFDGTDVDLTRVVSLFSNQEKKNELAVVDPQAYDRMKYTMEYIINECELPDNIDGVITTSLIREGVEIKSIIDSLYIDSHCQSDVVQVSGRIRKGGHELIMVVGAYEFIDPAGFEMEEITQRAQLLLIDMFNEELESKEDNKDKIDFINRIEDENPGKGKMVNPYIRFNYYTGKFEYYLYKQYSIEYAKRSYDMWHNHKEYGYKNYSDLVSQWFDGVRIADYRTKREMSYDLFFKKHKFKLSNEDSINSYNIDKVNRLIEDLRIVWGNKYKNINKLLSLFSDYECKACGKSGKKKFVKKKERENANNDFIQ